MLPVYDSFVWLKYSTVCLDHILFIHSSTDRRGRLDCLHLLAFVNNAVDTHVCVWVAIFNALGTYLEVESLGCMVILCLTFWGTTKLFSTVAEPFYIPISNEWGFQFLHILSNNCYFPVFKFFCYYSYPSGCEVVSAMVSMCISLVTTDVEHLFVLIGHIYIYLCHMCISLPWRSLFKDFISFNWIICLFFIEL